MALLFLVVIAATWRIGLAGRVLAGGDIFTYFYPYWAEATRALRAARLPLWNPNLFMGVPFAANSQVGIFYPLNWPLWLLLPAHRSVHVTIVLHLCLAALTAYVWGRTSLRLGRVASWTIGVTFSLGGYLGAQVEHVNQLQGLAWLPLLLMLTDRIVRPRSSHEGPAGSSVNSSSGRIRNPAACGSRIRRELGGEGEGGDEGRAGSGAKESSGRIRNPAASGWWIRREEGGEGEGRDEGRAGSSVNRSSGRIRNPAAGGSQTPKEPWRWSEEVVPAPRRLRSCCLLAVVVGMVLMAGHTQTAFISLFGVAAYGLGPELWRSLRGSGRGSTIRGAALLAAGATLGMALAAAQLLPTWELSQLSVRAGGLPFKERLSFSLSPGYLARALLPVFSGETPLEHIEHVAYVGVTGLSLAIAAGLMDLRRWRGSRGQDRRALDGLYMLMLLGLFFALGLYNPVYVLLARFVPGFAHFRVPARWLALYALGAAALAGHAVQALWQGRSLDRRRVLLVAGALAVLVLWALAGGQLSSDSAPSPVSLGSWLGLMLVVTALLLAASRNSRSAAIGLVAVSVCELFLAGRALPRARSTAPQAFTTVRPAIAHLLATETPDAEPRERFLSMSDTTFDPGDLALIKTIYGPQLSDAQLYDYVVATKQKEILSPNLPLAFGVPAVDGYDGGLLPLRRYVTLQRAFLSEDRVSIDGRLRENLRAIPEGRWLSLFNVRYVITDKLGDAWVDDVFYDLQFGARLSRGELAAVGEVPGFEGTALGVVSYLERGAALPEGETIGVVEVAFAGGDRRSFELRLGEHVPERAADGSLDDAMVTRLRWSDPARPLTVTVEATPPRGAWVVRGLSLIDERTGGFQSLVLSDRGRFRLAHSGDVKIYENLDALPRAFIASQVHVVDAEEAALRLMRDPAFDLSSQVVLSGNAPSCGTEDISSLANDHAGNAGAVRPTRVTVESFEPERVVIDATLDRAGILVLSDAHYPGWRATVDGEPAPVCRADLLFRAVALEPGEHRVVFTFRPPLQRVGIAASVAVLAVLVALWSAGRLYAGLADRP